ncbi:hypothetical protein DPMN_094091 [Dreissena polymorpha]|uniref:Uncharacterized protein n=1 Tax=Dreissena polymorpha TaxID=45954 RepID=A0A9D4R1M3_DREPO|nr:hypothetical protein DPMN_094091 [Dreissena polymorpha]
MPRVTSGMGHGLYFALSPVTQLTSLLGVGVMGTGDGLGGINILTKFHKDGMKTVTSTVYTRINILTKFHKDWMKTVTSTVYTNKLLTDTRTHTRTHIRTPDITQSYKLTMSLCDRFTRKTETSSSHVFKQPTIFSFV